jgi:FixJ family two-component response regulator
MRTNKPVALIGIVDDDEPVRDSVSSLIRSAGYRTVTFASAEAFLDSEQMREKTCLALILDIRLPGLSGLELQQKLCDLRYPTPVIFISAHTDDEVLARAQKQGARAFLGKPFSDEALLKAIQSAL